MFTTALVALDLSPAEGPMLDCLGELKDMGVARVVLTHVIRVSYVQGAAYGNEAEYAAWLERLAVPLRQAGFDVGIDVRDAGDVAREIIKAAADHRADLIMIGARGQNMLRGLFLGSTAREVIRLTRLPVRLEWIEATQEGTAAHCERVRHGGLKRLMLATDFSPHAAAAEATSAQLAAHAGAVDLVHVVTEADRARFTRWPVMARAALGSIGHEVEAAGGKAELHLPTGKPSEEIARIAAERDVSLIVTGKHGQNWVQSMVIGSTAAALCEIARRPVLMVPLNESET
ncbi:MAG: universal stress protein [Pseudorhodobacter sp.]|nr:universal stress protein [Pseudorhodobacter sp.]